ncbi:MAG: alpha/beta hydrolase [Dehalococcoidia bacterium]|nr:alpha/beta hydrolase [Dehalococcoidia bacterium]
MYVDTGEVKLYYEDEGEGLPLVVHHGGPDSDHTVICPFLRSLSEHVRLVCFDHRGTGKSSAPMEGNQFRFDNFVGDVESLRENLGLEQLALLGHSFGSMVAQHYALHSPERLSHLILVSTPASHEFIREGMGRVPEIVGPEAWKELDDISRRPPAAEGMKRSFLLQAPVIFRSGAHRLDRSRPCSLGTAEPGCVAAHCTVRPEEEVASRENADAGDLGPA